MVYFYSCKLSVQFSSVSQPAMYLDTCWKAEIGTSCEDVKGGEEIMVAQSAKCLYAFTTGFTDEDSPGGVQCVFCKLEGACHILKLLILAHEECGYILVSHERRMKVGRYAGHYHAFLNDICIS